MSLLGPNGRPIEEYTKAKVKSKRKPAIGNLSVGFGEEFLSNVVPWGNGNNLQYNTEKLTLADYRMMRDHYQVNSSLCLLTFMIHQTPFTVQCEDKKIAKHCDMNLRRIWTRLIRAMSQAFWAGFSPNALQWENDEKEGKVMLTKILDLRPEECKPKWKRVPAIGAGKQSIDPMYDGINTEGMTGINSRSTTKIFDGIHRLGYGDVQVENSLWYPVLQQEGNMYGKKLLNAAFQPWFFSLLIHMYANRYFERFGEPVMIARAPYDDTVDVTGNGQEIKGNVLMQGFARMIRNGAVPVLPNSKIQSGIDNDKDFEYALEYLESQMRGADFERYISRLDQEISLALFTPVLMTQTGDGGSFNLGITHANIYNHQLNAILADMKEYIDRYILTPMALYNFGEKHKPVEIKFRRLGGTDPETVRMVFNTLFSANKIELADIEEAGIELGMSIKEVEQVTEPFDPTDPNALDPKTGRPGAKPGDPDYDPKADPNNPKGTPVQKDTRQGRPERPQKPKGQDKKGKISSGLAKRLTEQYEAGNDVPDPGFKAKFADWFNTDLCNGFPDANACHSSYAVLAGKIETAYETARQIHLDEEIERFFSGVISDHLDLVEERVQV